MKRITFAALAAMTLATLALSAPAFAASPDFKAILKSVDELSDFGKLDYSAVYDIVSEKPSEKPTTTQIQIYRRDEHDQIVILIQKPAAQKGQGYLKIDDNVWFYDPEKRQLLALDDEREHQRLRGQELRLQEVYLHGRLRHRQDRGGQARRLRDLGAHPSREQRRGLVPEDQADPAQGTSRSPLKEEDFSVSDRPMRTTYYLPTYVQAGSKLIPAKIKMVDEVNKGTQSVLTISNVYVGNLEDKYFQKTFLESAR